MHANAPDFLRVPTPQNHPPPPPIPLSAAADGARRLLSPVGRRQERKGSAFPVSHGIFCRVSAALRPDRDPSPLRLVPQEDNLQLRPAFAARGWAAMDVTTLLNNLSSPDASLRQPAEQQIEAAKQSNMVRGASNTLQPSRREPCIATLPLGRAGLAWRRQAQPCFSTIAAAAAVSANSGRPALVGSSESAWSCAQRARTRSLSLSPSLTTLPRSVRPRAMFRLAFSLRARSRS